MSHRFLWPVGGVLALLVLAVSFNSTPAQRTPAIPIFGGQVGRFTVAHAGEKQIIILDTTSGKLYKATEKDFQKYSELPKTEGLEIPLPFLDKDKRKDGPRPKDAPVKDGKDVKPPKDAPARDRKKDDDELSRREKELREAERRAAEAEERARDAQRQALQERKRAEQERRAREEAERKEREKKKEKDSSEFEEKLQAELAVVLKAREEVEVALKEAQVALDSVKKAVDDETDPKVRQELRRKAEDLAERIQKLKAVADDYAKQVELGRKRLKERDR